ncbi:thioredoxin reductase [Planomicrobium koreense]|uniref:Thioredoxin reductase n=1 Tax=Planococcus koreensis TaxID=112331 RepID=A0A7W8FTJ6_9BACL|nr:NAD(P)-binding domain-containing protein [Planococcus koreensis]MBB5178822.1 thioredoxin reductase [Planococcus koreensis]
MSSQKNCCNPAVLKTPIHFTLPKKDNQSLPVAIIGGGPVGLAAAAHLVKAGESFILLEAGPSIAHHVLQWWHVRLFSPWRYNIDKAAKELLEKSGWSAPQDDELPTGKELADNYLIPLSKVTEIAPSIWTDAKVVGISRKGQDKMKTANRETLPFLLYIENAQGQPRRIEAKAVIDASGTWGQPNPLNASGVWTRQEKALDERIYYGIADVTGPNRQHYAGKHIAVAGGGHSAINTILELAELEDVKISWILRKANVQQAYGGEEKDALEARGELGSRIHELVDSGRVNVYTPFHVQHIEEMGDAISLEGEMKGQPFVLNGIDAVIVNAGSRPDLSMLNEIRTSIDPATESVEALAPLIDPNLHSCGTVRPHGEKELRQPEKDFYIVGMKSYGRAPTFLMATGYEQVRSIVAYLTGDFASAANLELELPETGVCSTNLNSASATCC